MTFGLFPRLERFSKIYVGKPVRQEPWEKPSKTETNGAHKDAAPDGGACVSCLLLQALLRFPLQVRLQQQTTDASTTVRSGVLMGAVR
ncbi:MAG: hypothetical protein AAFY06_13980, partial [Pseudomonadota bacterium]